MTLTEFLLARIQEDVAGAQQEAWMQARFSTPPFTVTYDWARITEHENGAQGTAFASGCPSPARVLAECEAKWAILRVHRADNVDEGGNVDQWSDLQGRRYCQGCNLTIREEWAELLDECPTLRALAFPYADHPDYRQEWTP